MFFSKKSSVTAGNSSNLQQQVVSCIANFYCIEQSVVATWVSGSANEVKVVFPFANKGQWEALRSTINASSAIHLSFEIAINAGQTTKPLITNIRNIVAIASGKGGVGKSTTAVNLAYALIQEGATVGILDADIYGPSVPIMLGNADKRPQTADNKHMQPIASHGLVANSIGYLVPAEDAAIWRGPMAGKALTQLLNETLWPVLDYLIVDMPPGTGDVQLTMAQQVPLTAAVIVTTPQDLAVADAQKGIAMFNKVNIPVLGLIENMSFYQCTACGHKDYIFAQDGGSSLAERHKLPLLGALPLDTKIRKHAGDGDPLVVAQPNSPLAQTYQDIARSLSQQLAVTIPKSQQGTGHIKGEPIAFNPVTDG